MKKKLKWQIPKLVPFGRAAKGNSIDCDCCTPGNSDYYDLGPGERRIDLGDVMEGVILQ